MARHKTLLVLASIALALLVPLSTAWKAQSDIDNHTLVKLSIEPYDPRDLLKGRYLFFAVKWNWGKEQGVCDGMDCCVCLGPGDADPQASLMNCSAQKPPQCTHMLKGSKIGEDRFDIGVNRYYVDEHIALPLEDLFRNNKEKFHVGLSISPSGKYALENLYVGGMQLKDYVDSKGGTLERIP